MYFYIFCLALLKFSSSKLLDSPKLIFTGQSYSDVKTMTIYSNFSTIFNTNYFEPNKPTVLIVHGFEGSYVTPSGRILVDAFLSRPEYNLIFADWSEKAIGSYFSVVYVISDVAETFVQLLNKIQASDYNLSNIYIVGHSLGAHVAGRIGSLLQSQNIIIPRITGLDPAGPLFNWVVLIQKLFGEYVIIPRFRPLTKGDARFVDIVHSNAGWFRGLVFSIGDIDFWPNGGSIQPMCTGCEFFNIFSNLDKCSSCNHLASAYYYAESVKSKNSLFIARRCSPVLFLPFDTFCRGPEVASMGYHASSLSKPGDYFLTTRVTAPYSN